MPISAGDQSDLVDRLAEILTNPRADVRAAARHLLRSTLQLARFPKGHPLAALSGTDGFHRLSSFELERITRQVSDDFETTSPDLHARAKKTLAEALGSYVMDTPA
jgi:hypothetical protein